MKRTIYIFYIFIISLFLFSCVKKDEAIYNITFDLDGGYLEEELPNEFKVSDNYKLPNPEKEGMVFIGWVDLDNENENKFILELGGRDYNLKALFVEEFEYNTINYEEIFSQKESEYLIYFYRDGCTWCNKIKNGVLSYLYKISLPQFASSKKLYVVNLTENGTKASIFKSYDGENGDNDGTYKVNGLTTIDEMCISSTPTLIEIKENNGIKEASLLAVGATKVLNEINNGLSYNATTSNDVTYTICLNTNGGSIESSEIIYFKDPESVILPTPKKDGFIFLGWTDGLKIVERIERKDYELSALWEINKDYDSIDENQIFTQIGNSYYVYIYRDGCSWCEKISERVKAYLYKIELSNYSESIKVYPLNLTKDGVKASIFRTYTGSDGEGSEGTYKVTGATDISDMYIASTPALIRIDRLESSAIATFITSGATNVITEIEKGLVYNENGVITKQEYQIEYDLNGGYFESDPVTIFYPWQEINLPIPQKDGFVFVGWYEDGENVTKVEEKDYKVVAQYKEIIIPEEIMANDIYSVNEDEYYICFIKNDLYYYNELMKYLNLLSFKEDISVYLIDLENSDNKMIKRSYTGEDGQSETGRFFVNGVSNIDNLYIPKASALIKVVMEEDIKVSYYIESGEDIISFIKANYER